MSRNKLLHKKIIREKFNKAIQDKGSNCTSYEDAWKDFSGEYKPTQEEAEALCRGCPLLNQECLRYILTTPETYGVWDGKFYDRYPDEEEN